MNKKIDGLKRILAKTFTQREFDALQRKWNSMLNFECEMIKFIPQDGESLEQINEIATQSSMLFKEYATTNGLKLLSEFCQTRYEDPYTLEKAEQNYLKDKENMDRFDQILLKFPTDFLHEWFESMLSSAAIFMEKKLLSTEQIEFYLNQLTVANNWCDQNNKPRLKIRLI